jgi:hypothetical protein
VDEALLARWVDAPAQRLAAVSANAPAISRLKDELRDALAGRTLTAGWIHGDFWAGNLLVTPNGQTITGILDWDLAGADELPSHDLYNLVLSTEQLVRGGGLGDGVCKRLKGARPYDWEHALLSAYLPFSDAARQRASLILFWLRYVATCVEKGPRRALSGWWLTKNVEAVLDCL